MFNKYTQVSYSSHVKILCFPILREKTTFTPGNDGRWEGWWCPPTPIPFSTALRLQAAMEELHNLKLQENLHGEFLFRRNTASKSSLTLILPRRFPKKFLKSSEQCLFAFLNGHLLWRECLSGNLLTKTKAAVWWLCS